MTATSHRTEVPFLWVFAAIMAASVVLAQLAVGPSLWGQGSLVLNVVFMAVSAFIWLFFDRRRTQPLPRSIPWTRAALSVLFMPLLFVGAAYAGEFFLAFGQVVGMMIARATVRHDRLIDI